MTTSKSVLAFGHSHLRNIGDAIELLETDSRSPFRSTIFHLYGKYDPFYRVENGREVYNGDMLRDLSEIVSSTKPDIIAAILLGSEYFAFSIPETPRVFDLIIPDMRGLEPLPGAELIPYDVVYEMAYETYRPFFGLMRQLQEDTGIPVFHLIPSPPTADTSFILSHMPESLRRLTESNYMPSASQIYKIWSVYSAAMRGVCSDLGVQTVLPPPEALDEFGLLRVEFAGDSLHGNTRYGALVVEQLARIIADRAGEGKSQ